MSWGRSVSGLAAVILAAAKGWRDEVQETDNKYSASNNVKRGHAAQCEAAEVAVERIAYKFPDHEFDISASGHANEDGSGYVTVGYKLRDPVPAAETQGDGSGGLQPGDLGEGTDDQLAELG